MRFALRPYASLAEALHNNWLELWYQPKIDLRSRLVCGAEALIRLRHPTHGVVEPGRFLPAPGDVLYRPLTDFIVERSLRDWVNFADHRVTNRLAINVPASVLERPEFVAHLREHLPNHPKFPGLIVEITEDEAIRDPELAREVAVQLKLYNVHVSIDDFGSGYSSLARLKELPFAEVKLDRSFVSAVPRTAPNAPCARRWSIWRGASTSPRSLKASKRRRISRIEVTDSGAGMPKEILDKIFEPFFTTK